MVSPGMRLTKTRVHLSSPLPLAALAAVVVAPPVGEHAGQWNRNRLSSRLVPRLAEVVRRAAAR